MGRPVKWRRIDQMPTVLQFVPSVTGLPTAGTNILLIEEYEAIRLKDLACLEQEECAAQMQVSRPTFQRILTTGRQKVADSLANGKGIRIEGGHYTRNICPVRCLDCGMEWSESVENLDRMGAANRCPQCGSKRVVCAMGEGNRGRGQGQGNRNRYCQRNCNRNRDRMPDGMNRTKDETERG